MTLAEFGMILIAFACGSLPFSVWTARLLTGKDVRTYGDGNPGAANAFRTGSPLAGLLALMLDISKATVPVGLAYFNLGIRGLPMFLIAIAPMLGHMFSPFLRFRGGKALATTLGIWIGLTLWKASLPCALGAVVGILLFTPPVWSVALGMSAVLATVWIALPDPLLFAVWAAQILLLAWTHRADLRQGLHLRPWLAKALRRTE